MIEWPTTIAEARRIQDELSSSVTLSHLREAVKTVAGVDAAFSGGMTIGAVALYELDSMSYIEESHHVEATRFPYVPGYLSFREGGAILAAIAKLRRQPDVIMVDGQGIAHPKRLGIASFLGVLLEVPTIGCAKSRLVGDYEEPQKNKGAWSKLYLDEEIVGGVLRTRTGVKPVFVSPGHLVTLAESLELVLRCCTRYRLPEPLRHADSLSKRLKKEIT